MTVRDLLQRATTISRRDADVLLAQCAERTKPWLIAHADERVSAEIAQRFLALVARRAGGEPLQYLTGVQEFFGLTFLVNPSVLIPRAETEHLVEAVLDWIGDAQREVRVLDVGTGSGAIALTLATRLKKAEITAADLSPAALALAKENASRLRVERNVTFQQANLVSETRLSNLDVIVANPPYVPEADLETMQREVVDHEPHLALFAGKDGLDIYRRLIPQAYSALRTGGLLAMEFGYGQKDAMSTLLQGWDRVRFIDDYAGIPRVVLAERSQAHNRLHAQTRQ